MAGGTGEGKVLAGESGGAGETGCGPGANLMDIPGEKRTCSRLEPTRGIP